MSLRPLYSTEAQADALGGRLEGEEGEEEELAL
jgi:hypothetical protein